MKSRYRLFLTLLIVLPALPAVAFSQSQIVFVDVNRVLEQSAQGQAEAARLNNLIATRQQAINAERDALNNLQKQLTEGLTLSPQEVNRLQQQMQAKNTEIDRMREDAQAELDLEQNLVLRQLSENLSKLVSDLAQERSYGAVILRSPDRQIFVREALDITQEVIQLYDEKYPAN